jgi:hypothetical protein
LQLKTLPELITDVDRVWDCPSRLTCLLRLLGARLERLQNARAACDDPEATSLLSLQIAMYRARHIRAWHRREELV